MFDTQVSSLQSFVKNAKDYCEMTLCSGTNGQTIDKCSQSYDDILKSMDDAKMDFQLVSTEAMAAAVETTYNRVFRLGIGLVSDAVIKTNQEGSTDAGTRWDHYGKCIGIVSAFANESRNLIGISPLSKELIDRLSKSATHEARAHKLLKPN